MGIFSRKRRLVDLGGSVSGFGFDIVGEMAHMPAIRALATPDLLKTRPSRSVTISFSGRSDGEPETDRKWLPATLVREPNNRHDRNAVAVFIHGARVGYLARDEAPAWSNFLAELERQGFVGMCRAAFFGRSADGPIGVKLDLDAAWPQQAGTVSVREFPS